MLLPILLVLAGMAFIIAEVFLVSMGLLGAIAAGFILTGDVLAFEHSRLFGWTLVVLEIVLIPVLIRGAFQVLPKLPFGRRMLLGPPTTKPGQAPPEFDDLVGKTGEALSDLRPSGIARIDGRRLSVVALGSLIPEHTDVVVVGVDGSEIRVKTTAPLPDESTIPLL